MIALGTSIARINFIAVIVYFALLGSLMVKCGVLAVLFFIDEVCSLISHTPLLYQANQNKQNLLSGIFDIGAIYLCPRLSRGIYIYLMSFFFNLAVQLN